MRHESRDNTAAYTSDVVIVSDDDDGRRIAEALRIGGIRSRVIATDATRRVIGRGALKLAVVGDVDTVRWIRSELPIRHIAVVLLSASAGGASSFEQDWVLTRPVSADGLVPLFRTLIATAEQRRR